MQGTVNLMMKRAGGEEVENIGFIDDDKPWVPGGTVQDVDKMWKLELN